MYRISLNDIELYGHHGWHAEEEIAGAMFRISILIDFEETEPIEKLEQTINYVDVYDQVKDVMDKPTRLLESVVSTICDRVSDMDERIQLINVSITKLNPPVSNFIGNISVSLTKKIKHV